MRNTIQPPLITRRHSMPFGVARLDGDRTRFRLWAPSADHVTLVLNQGNTEHEMSKTPDGFAECVLSTADAPVGSLYQFKVNDSLLVPDPASRYQPQDVHGPSMILDPEAFSWKDADWRGRPWEETVIYELHVGSFSEKGTFEGVIEKLDELVALGVTAIELMPLSDFPGQQNWGYDGVLPFAPDACYGHPDDLKRLIQTAHGKGLMVFLDVVYNHFGPEGNYLYAYAAPFFTEHYHTPWGAAINFELPHPAMIREFFIHNALYWLEEYHLDGLRFDAVHAIYDASERHFLEELAEAVYQGPGRDRPIRLMLENDHNQACFLKREADGQPELYTAQWNDDIHHVLHTLITGEKDGYYSDYAKDNAIDPVGLLVRCLTEGFAYQGEPSPYRENVPRGECSNHLPPTAFISFIQNHDQVGNRAFGDRLTHFASAERIRLALGVVLLSPQIPMLFMGEEWAAGTPFPFFCDFEPDLAPKVTEGRRKEFARFPQFSNPEMQARIPDPCSHATFENARLNWQERGESPHSQWLSFYRTLLTLRRQKIVPLLRKLSKHTQATATRLGDQGFEVQWLADDGQRLILLMNWGEAPVAYNPPDGMLLTAIPESAATSSEPGILSSMSSLWFLTSPD